MKHGRTRREFGKAVASLAAAPAGLALASAAAAQAPAAQEPKPNATPREATAAALHDILRARYGKHLSEEQLKRLRPRLANNLVNAEAMGRVALVNADEPAFVFVAPDAT